MGKRAASKPKAAGSGPANRGKVGSSGPTPPPSPAQRRKVEGGCSGPPPPPAPSHWKRPDPPALADLISKPLRFFLVDIEDGPVASGNTASELRLYGVTAEGFSVCARLRDVHPYFYAAVEADAVVRADEVRIALESIVTARNSWQTRGQPVVVNVEAVRRTPVLVYQQESELLKVTVAGQSLVAPCVKALEQGFRLPAREGGEGASEVKAHSTFEANIPLVLRFLVDRDLGGGRWVELAAGSFRAGARPRATTAQLEVDVLADAAAGLHAVPLDTDVGSSVPPVRTLALECFVDSESQFCAAACVLSVQGEACPRARAVWIHGTGTPPGDRAGEFGEIIVEEYDPSKVEPASIFVSGDEEALLQHLGKTLATIDADILLAYDVAQTMRGLLGKKAIAKPGSVMACGLCRRLTSELKLSQKTNELWGLAGRLGFGLAKQVEKEHKLIDYSLSALSEYFCQSALPELREVTLVQLLQKRPRAFAQHVLRQAEASLRVFDHLAYLFNFVEMARVTGCPLTYLLERGQAVKVQAQLLREARKRGFVLPSERPGTGDETSFDGATVLDPTCGFYRSPVAVLDFASLYPSIMLAHNICYSTLLSPGREKHPDAPAHHVVPAAAVIRDSDTGQATCFVDGVVRKGLLPSILEGLLAARKAAKKELKACDPSHETRRKVLHGRQLALKLSANSVYGFTGAMNGPLPCLEVAGAVTAYGREMIQATKKRVEEHFVRARGYAHDAEVLYGDTDSVMVRFGADDLALSETMKLSAEAAELCSAAFPAPVCLEFEKVYRPFLLMNKKRYAGLAWASADDKAPKMETKGIETVRRDWSDLVRQGLEHTLQLLLRADGGDGEADAIAYVRGLSVELKQNKVDFRSLVISKSLGRDEYATKMPHVEVAEKLRKRDPANAPRLGDRVSFLVLAGAAKSKVFERAEDPLYALENELPVDAEYYLEHQLKPPLIRVFELVCGSVQKAEQALFAAGAGHKVVAATTSSMGGMGKFMKVKPKCLACNTVTVKADGDPFCVACEAKGPEHAQHVKEACISKAQRLRAELATLRAHCDDRCSVPSGAFPELQADNVGTPPVLANTLVAPQARESCENVNCQVIFRRARVAKELKAATDAVARLKVSDW